MAIMRHDFNDKLFVLCIYCLYSYLLGCMFVAVLVESLVDQVLLMHAYLIWFCRTGRSVEPS